MQVHTQVNAKHFATPFDWLDTSFDQQYLNRCQTLAAELAKWEQPVSHLPVQETGFRRTTVR